MERNKLIRFRNIVKNFDGQIVLKGINLDIYEKEFVTLLGPSGCGKTTLLRILGGFLPADEGSVIFDGEEISNKPPYERELNTVFQKYALFPHLSVYENIAFGLKIKKMSKDIIDQKVMKMLKLIGLEGYENKNTTLLSGGQQRAHTAHRQHLFQGTDGGEIAQMDGAVALAVCPGDQTVFDVVVDHGGGQRIPVVKVDELPGHIGDQLVHIQSDVGQGFPVGGPLLLHAGFQIQ